MDSFRKSNSDILLASLKCMSAGLNLVHASHVVILDLWWNPYIEDQAIGRVHRIGQTKEVYVTRFIMVDTVEEKILMLQNQKREMVEDAMGTGAGLGKALTTKDVINMLGFSETSNNAKSNVMYKETIYID